VDNTKGGSTMKATVKARYEKDSRRYHRYSIVSNSEGVVGTLYLLKSSIGTPIEISVTISTEEKSDADHLPGGSS
jgi:hypothetical protein